MESSTGRRTTTGTTAATTPGPTTEERLVARAVAPQEADDAGLRRDLLATWVDVSEAGGAVGFVPPVDPAAVASALDHLLDRVRSGTDVLVVLQEEPSGRVVGLGVLVRGTVALTAHWRTVRRLMVRPERQGRGAGRLLLEGVHDAARDLGLEQLALTVRGGQGLEPFYERLGYVECGRMPGALRIAPGDDRDEVQMVRRL
ncbi:GNAT family N-acetyltransferase [Pseudokineococcus basanitobsidens]|uniref:GNAT family N-acetyltransferase n=1 Tax=Pseudokineococcus basanitobsidens TaxID=1926649 RepID=A0ABU8RNA3_9ACTN